MTATVEQGMFAKGMALHSIPAMQALYAPTPTRPAFTYLARRLLEW